MNPRVGQIYCDEHGYKLIILGVLEDEAAIIYDVWEDPHSPNEPYTPDERPYTCDIDDCGHWSLDDTPFYKELLDL